MYYISEPLVVEQLYQLMELPEANKSSAADKPENKGKTNWIQVKERVAARSRVLYVIWACI
jgi:hypothetical protein